MSEDMAATELVSEPDGLEEEPEDIVYKHDVLKKRWESDTSAWAGLGGTATMLGSAVGIPIYVTHSSGGNPEAFLFSAGLISAPLAMGSITPLCVADMYLNRRERKLESFRDDVQENTHHRVLDGGYSADMVDLLENSEDTYLDHSVRRTSFSDPASEYDLVLRDLDERYADEFQQGTADLHAITHLLQVYNPADDDTTDGTPTYRLTLYDGGKGEELVSVVGESEAALQYVEEGKNLLDYDTDSWFGPEAEPSVGQKITEYLP